MFDNWGHHDPADVPERWEPGEDDERILFEIENGAVPELEESF